MKTINKRRAAAATAAAGMVLTPLGLLPMELAHAAGDGSFRANVENNDGDSVPGAKVTLYSTATGAAVGTPKVIATTDDPNTYEDETQSVTFTGLNTGTYLVKVEDPSGKYVTEYSTADEITPDDSWAAAYVSLNPRTSGLGELSGTVTQKTDDSYFEARVFVYPDTATQASIDSGDTWHVASTWLYDSDYEGGKLRTISQKWDLKLAPGKYKVRVVDYDSQNCNNNPCTFTRQAWAGGTNADDATVITVSSRTTSATPSTTLPEDVEPSVSAPGRIQGTVTGAGGAKLDNVQVTLFQKSGEEWRWVASEVTGDDGAYKFSTMESYCDYNPGTYEEECGPIPAGDFTLKFTDEAGYGDNSEYGQVFYNNVRSDDYYPPAAAGTLTVPATGTVTVNATMSKNPLPTTGAKGKITSDNGVGQRGRIWLYDASGEQVAYTRTHRDGTWALPITSLAPGSYRAYADANSDKVVDGWVGGTSFRKARIFTVPIKGQAAVANANLLRYGFIKGKVSAALPAGTNQADYSAFLWYKSGRSTSMHIENDGTFSTKVEPGSYRVSGDGIASDKWDESDADISVPLIEKFWKSGWFLPSASTISVRSGATVSGINIQVGNRLVAVSGQKITGVKKPGKTLAVAKGTWNADEDVRYSYVWKRGSKVVSRTATYKLTRKDKGKKLTVTITAEGVDYTTGTKAVSVTIPR